MKTTPRHRKSVKLVPLRPSAWFFGLLGAWGVVVLACGSPSDCPTSDPYCSEPAGLSPEKQTQLREGQDALLGTWELTQSYVGRDSVDRPLPAGSATFELEIYHVEVRSPYEDEPVVRWKGAVRAGAACLVPSDQFAPDGGACEELAPVFLGYCSATECRRVPERAVEGTYHLRDDLLSIDGFSSVSGGFHFYDPSQGYLNLRTYIFTDVYLAQGREQTPCEGSWCSWSTDPKGLFENQFPTLSENTRSDTFLRIDDTHRATDEVDEAEQVVPIGARTAAEEKLLGAWNVTMRLGSRDAVDRPVEIGSVGLVMDVFELEPGGLVGDWRFKGAVRGANVCLVSADNAANTTWTCDPFDPVGTGSCTNTDCTEGGEVPIEGVYNELDNRLELDEARVGVYYLDPALGFIYTAVYVYLADGTLPVQTVEATSCAGSWCSWTLRTTGAFATSHPSTWTSDTTTFEMSRP